MGSFSAVGGGKNAFRTCHLQTPSTPMPCMELVISPGVAKPTALPGPPCPVSPQHSWGFQAAPRSAAHACVQHVDGSTGRVRERKKKSIWQAVSAAGAVADAAIYTIFTFWRTKSGRLPANLRNSALPRTAAQPVQKRGRDRPWRHRHGASLS